MILAYVEAVRNLKSVVASTIVKKAGNLLPF